MACGVTEAVAGAAPEAVVRELRMERGPGEIVTDLRALADEIERGETQIVPRFAFVVMGDNDTMPDLYHFGAQMTRCHTAGVYTYAAQRVITDQP